MHLLTISQFVRQLVFCDKFYAILLAHSLGISHLLKNYSYICLMFTLFPISVARAYKIAKLSSSKQLQLQLNWDSLIITIGPNPTDPTRNSSKMQF